MRSEHLSSGGRAFRLRFEWPACPRCGEPLLAAESSRLIGRERVRHSWSCDECGYSFQTAVQVRAPDDLE